MRSIRGRLTKFIALTTSTLFMFSVVSTLAAPLAGAVTTQVPSSIFYLAVGASFSVGVQPTSTDPTAHPTEHGYTNDLVALEAAKGVTLTLTHVGCPGDSTTNVLFGDPCYPQPTTQLTTAVAFLQAHFNDRGLVTIDLGFNNINGCLTGMTVDQTCLNKKLLIMTSELTTIVATLKSAAGPHVTFIGVNHYNPYFADSIRGSKGQHFAHLSSDVFSDFNAALKSVYDHNSVPLANVSKVFHDSVYGSGVNVSSYGRVHGYLATTCKLTWMCRSSRYGPNLHPTNAGYQAIARAIDAVLPTSW